eukprot:scaffold6313_cov297-Ochromonas_danica.AAC.1
MDKEVILEIGTELAPILAAVEPLYEQYLTADDRIYVKLKKALYAREVLEWSGDGNASLADGKTPPDPSNSSDWVWVVPKVVADATCATTLGTTHASRRAFQPLRVRKIDGEGLSQVET